MSPISCFLSNPLLKSTPSETVCVPNFWFPEQYAIKVYYIWNISSPPSLVGTWTSFCLNLDFFILLKVVRVPRSRKGFVSPVRLCRHFFCALCRHPCFCTLRLIFGGKIGEWVLCHQFLLCQEKARCPSISPALLEKIGECVGRPPFFLLFLLTWTEIC